MPYGKVMVVDDNATNLFVAEGLLSVYKLDITTVDSGFAAIDKINDGNVYDIVFMDHMMPKMDGVETVKKIRGGGYTAPIVALTANALSGAEKMFRQNGFDGFILKPIDKKALNDVLVTYIQEKYPDEAAKVPAMLPLTADNAQPAPADEMPDEYRKKLTEVFLLDAENALKILPETANSPNNRESDIKLFAITAHAMKSALANMGNHALSERAKELEFSAEDHKTINEKLPGFLDDLRAYVKELSLETTDESGDETELDTLPTGKLEEFINACENYDEMTAEAILTEIMSLHLAKETKAALTVVSQKLMVSEFEEAAELAGELNFP
jgi:CheY-like chemotaxis protein